MTDHRQEAKDFLERATSDLGGIEVTDVELMDWAANLTKADYHDAVWFVLDHNEFKWEKISARLEAITERLPGDEQMSYAMAHGGLASQFFYCWEKWREGKLDEHELHVVIYNSLLTSTVYNPPKQLMLLMSNKVSPRGYPKLTWESDKVCLYGDPDPDKVAPLLINDNPRWVDDEY